MHTQLHTQMTNPQYVYLFKCHIIIDAPNFFIIKFMW